MIMFSLGFVSPATQIFGEIDTFVAGEVDVEVAADLTVIVASDDVDVTVETELSM